MIEIIYEQGRHWPIVRCDACQEQIVDHQKAHVVWNGLSDSGPVYHVHKGACNERVYRQIEAPGGHAYWDALDSHLSRLAFNVGMKSPKDFTSAKSKVTRDALFAI